MPNLIQSSNKCCRCNGKNAVCKNCSCVKNGVLCTNCLPAQANRCNNICSPNTSDTSNTHRPTHFQTSSSAFNSSPAPHSQTDPGRQGASEHLTTQLTSEDIIRHMRIANSRILKYVPSASRAPFTQALADVISEINKNSTALNWLRLFLMPALVLAKPKERNGSRRRTSLSSSINKQIVEFNLARNILQILDLIQKRKGTVNPEQGQGSGRPRKATRSDDEKFASLINEMLDDGNVRGAVRIASSTDVFAPPSPENLTIIRSKHPTTGVSDQQPFPNDQASPKIHVDPDDVLREVRNFPKGSAGGLSGLRPQHLKDCLLSKSLASSRRLLLAITEMCNDLLAGDCIEEVRPVLFGARLISLKKKDGGIRPIAIGDVFRRLTAKLGVHKLKPRVSQYLSPFQLGCGVPGGIDVAVHSARYSMMNAEEDSVFLKIDISNAFNTIDRRHVANCLEEVAPEILPFFKLSYSKPSNLVYGPDIILSSSGLQQGAPDAPMEFSIGIQKFVQAINSKLKIAYLDDISLCDNWRTVLADVVKFKESCQRIGLKLNTSKCEITVIGANSASILQEFQEVCPDIRLVPPDDLELLGSSIGKRSLSISLKRSMDSLERMIPKLSLLSSHNALYLLRNCFHIPKFLHILRTSPAYSEPSLLQDMDSLTAGALSKLLNVEITAKTWQQITLPTKYGGLGIPSIKFVATSAFIASAMSSILLMNRILPPNSCEDITQPVYLSEAVKLWHDTNFGIECPGVSKQSAWTNSAAKGRLENLLSCSNTTDRARLNGCAAPGSGDWLHAIPSDKTGTRLSNEQLRIAVCLRLGANVFLQHTCVCGAESDSKGNHALCCKLQRGRIARHTLCNDIILRALNSTGTPSQTEPPGLSRTDGKRPDGVSLIPWSHGKSVIWDFTCAHRLATSLRHLASEPGASIAAYREGLKAQKYKELAIQNSLIFHPVSCETLGGFGPESIDFIQEIGAKIAAKTGDKRASAFLRQRLGIAIQIGNAVAISEAITKYSCAQEKLLSDG